MADAGAWPWLALAGLGAFHGLNPAMGWLFAVALGLHRGGRRTVLLALLPIALGHAVSVLVVVLVVLASGLVIDPGLVRRAAGLVLLGWAAWHALYGHRHRVRFGMTTGMAGLAAWSFLMATAHGAGLMLIPLLAPLGAARPRAPRHDRRPASARRSPPWRSTASPCSRPPRRWRCWSTSGSASAILRRGWVNLDLVWTAALVAVGVWLLL